MTIGFRLNDHWKAAVTLLAMSDTHGKPWNITTLDRSIVYPWAMFATWWRDKQPPRRAHGVTLSYSLFPGCQRCFSTAKEWETDDVMNGDWNWDSTPRVVPSYSWFLSRMFLCVLWFFCVSSPLTRLEYWVRDSWTTWTCGMIVGWFCATANICLENITMNELQLPVRNFGSFPGTTRWVTHYSWREPTRGFFKTLLSRFCWG